MKVYFDPMAEIEQARDLNNFKKLYKCFDAITKFIRSLNKQ